ncbi:TPA: hypothetical protein N0F65_010416 [Lagenidium giganteum]|uniref:Uncharacterized protein n=1 Tax=Lagenidium giganteum TaxID=4803 RepID=A0AAV2YV47_9STRA|nr:TPA: hypothetical protein N0F65_010416 [Lagenidium giganteum]
MDMADWCGKPCDLFQSSRSSHRLWRQPRNGTLRGGTVLGAALGAPCNHFRPSTTLNTQVYGNRAGWSNADLTVTFLRHHFGTRDQPASLPVLLLLEAGHWTDSVRNCAATLNVHLMQVPPNLTWRA